MEIAANPRDDERRGEIGDVEVAPEILDLDGDSGRDRDAGIVAQLYFGDAGAGRYLRRRVGIDLNRGMIGAGDFQISGGADDAD